MKKQVYIKIRSSQIVDSERDTAELFTEGVMEARGGGWTVKYERPATQEEAAAVTTMEMERTGRVTLTTGGGIDYELVLEKNKRTVGQFKMGHAVFTVGTNTSVADLQMGEHGGSVHLKYTLDSDMMVMSENEIFMDIEPARP